MGQMLPGDSAKPWQLLLMGIGSVQSVQAGRAEIILSGAMVTPGDYGSRLAVYLSEPS